MAIVLLIKCDSIELCIETVKSGKADSTVVNALRVAQLVSVKKRLLISPMSVADARCFGVLPENTGLLRILHHGISILGEDYGLTHAYQYIDGLVTYTVWDGIRSSGRAEADSIPIAAVTAYVSEEARIESFHAGIYTFLTKPVDGEKMIRTVAGMVKR